jgi:hypothetical protein
VLFRKFLLNLLIIITTPIIISGLIIIIIIYISPSTKRAIQHIQIIIIIWVLDSTAIHHPIIIQIKIKKTIRKRLINQTNSIRIIIKNQINHKTKVVILIKELIILKEVLRQLSPRLFRSPILNSVKLNRTCMIPFTMPAATKIIILKIHCPHIPI